MEEQLPTTSANTYEQQKKATHKKLIFSLSAIVLLIVIIIATFFALKSTSLKKGTIAPSSESLANPLKIQVSLGFSTYFLKATNKVPTTVDINLQSIGDEGISEGIIVLTYDPFMTTNVNVRPITGPTALLPNAIFSDVRYNPNNVVIAFSLPEGSSAITGSGRIAALTFTPVAYNKVDKTSLSFDLKRSEIYSIKDGQKKLLKPSKGNLDITIQP